MYVFTTYLQHMMTHVTDTKWHSSSYWVVENMSTGHGLVKYHTF